MRIINVNTDIQSQKSIAESVSVNEQVHETEHTEPATVAKEAEAEKAQKKKSAKNIR